MIGSVIGSLINIPDCPGVAGTCTDNTKCSGCPELVAPGVDMVAVDVVTVDVVVFALDLWPKLGRNCPSFPPPGQ